MSIKAKREFECLVRAATRCRECFTREEVEAPTIDVAQPRPVGRRYWERTFRVVILTINPGRSPKNSKTAKEYPGKIQRFQSRQMELDELLDHELEKMKLWGRPPGRFREFYGDSLGLEFDDLAFANIAWCATATNSYPDSMLKRCFESHTGHLLSILCPTVVLASGSKAHSFSRRIHEVLPETTVIKVMHYAHRKGRAAEREHLRQVRSELDALRAAHRHAG